MDKEKITRKLKGIIKSDKMDKTVVVTVTTRKKHPKYHKYFSSSKNFKAHDENNQYKEGDSVVIAETRPLSKEKRWEVVEMIKESAQETPEEETPEEETES